MKLNKITFLIFFIILSFFFIGNLGNSLFAEQKFSKDIDKSNEFLHPDKAFIPTLTKINDNHLRVKWKIEDGYYLYMGMFKFQIEGNNIEIDKVAMPDGLKKTDEFFGDVDVFYNFVQADIFLKNSPKDDFKLIIYYQGCADAGLCYPPIKKTLKVDIQSNEGYFLQTSFSDDQIGINNSLQTESILYNMFFFYLIGVLLAFTPCVFPMIPILTGLIIGQGQNISTKKSFLLSFTYVISMSITYSLIGIIFALSGSNIQANLQNPYVISSFAILFLILALSMFKVINLQMPRFILTSLSKSSDQQKSGSFFGVGIMGALSALIIGPCVTAPLIGALLYIASSKDYVLGGFALFALGFGMGTPLLALGTSATSLIKKVGPYLDLVNKFFGLLFFIVGIWLLERIMSIQVAAYLWAIVPITVIVLINTNKSKIQTSLRNFFSTTVTLVMSAYAVLLIYGANVNQNFIPITSFIQKPIVNKFITVNNSSDLLREIKKSNNVTMVDLYADWCVACKEFEMYVFNDSKVSKVFKNLNLVKFDITETNEDHVSFLEKHNLFGPPVLMFFGPEGNEINKSRVIGFVDAESLIKKINSLNL